jgi:hypothetical protein
VWKRVGVDGEGVPSRCFRAWLVVLVILIFMFSLCMMRPALEQTIVKEAQEKKIQQQLQPARLLHGQKGFDCGVC